MASAERGDSEDQEFGAYRRGLLVGTISGFVLFAMLSSVFIDSSQPSNQQIEVDLAQRDAAREHLLRENGVYQKIGNQHCNIYQQILKLGEKYRIINAHGHTRVEVYDLTLSQTKSSGLGRVSIQPVYERVEPTQVQLQEGEVSTEVFKRHSGTTTINLGSFESGAIVWMDAAACGPKVSTHDNGEARI